MENKLNNELKKYKKSVDNLLNNFVFFEKVKLKAKKISNQISFPAFIFFTITSSINEFLFLLKTNIILSMRIALIIMAGVLLLISSNSYFNNNKLNLKCNDYENIKLYKILTFKKEYTGKIIEETNNKIILILTNNKKRIIYKKDIIQKINF